MVSSQPCNLFGAGPNGAATRTCIFRDMADISPSTIHRCAWLAREIDVPGGCLDPLCVARSRNNWPGRMIVPSGVSRVSCFRSSLLRRLAVEKRSTARGVTPKCEWLAS